MLLFFHQWILVSALPFSLCLTQGASYTTSAPPLLELFPKCARSCVEDFILSEYPKNACSTGCDLGYLCRVNTASGYTLGEAALRCSLAMCSMEVALEYSSYSVCDSIPGALPRTHATIVATIMSVIHSTTSTSTTETKTLEITSSITSDPIDTQTAPTSATITTFQTPISATDTSQGHDSTSHDPPISFSLPSITSSSISSESPSTAPSSGSRLDPAAVIGVSVASGVSAFFILGVIIFFCCRKIRRRNQQQRGRDFFEIGGVMSEPPDFGSLPRLPTRGANAPSCTMTIDSESVRLVPPPEASYRNPEVVVSQHNNDYYGPAINDNADRIGLALSSNFDFEPARSESSRTVSDLLPDKPSYELYPKPLRWSQYKKHRPNSGETLFEENIIEPNNFLDRQTRLNDFLSLTGQHNRNGTYTRRPIAGLPANPRAMLYGPGRGPGEILVAKGQYLQHNPAYAPGKENTYPSGGVVAYNNPPHRRSHVQMVDQHNDLNNYWQIPEVGFVETKVLSPHNTARNSIHSIEANMDSLDEPGYDFETININDNSDSHRASRHSGNFRPLTPVREIKTPTGEPQKPNCGKPIGKTTPLGYPQSLVSRALNPAQEIISRPRIVRRDDIKRVQIRRGRPQPKELTVPYSPDDYWLGSAHEYLSGSQPSRNPREYKYASERMTGRMPKKKPSPLERNLTPSRRDPDLILQGDRE